MKIISHQLKDFILYGFDNDYIFSIIKNTNNFYEIEVLEKWNQYFENVKIILDVGANIGNHSIYWSQLENVNKIISFEPVPKTFKLLKQNVTANKINKIEIHRLALGKKDGFGIINKEDPGNLGATSLKFVEDKTDIKIVSGDAFLYNKDNAIDLLKVDVEGFEINVLKGFEKTIKQYKPILWVEISLNNLQKVLNLLNTYGYFVIDIIKFNILAIHKTKIGSYSEISKDKLIFNMLKNLKASWMYRNSYLDSEKQKKQEIIRLNELKKQNERHLSQFLYEQKINIDLCQKNESIESNLLRQQKKVKKLRELNEKRVSQFLYEQRKAKNLKNQNEHLKRLLETYQKRKVVKITDSILKAFRFLLQKQIHSNKDSLNSSREKNASSRLTNSYSQLNSQLNFGVSKKEVKKLKDIKIAVILDEFSYNCFKYEFNAIPVEPSNWLEIFETEKPDLFFCESAWSGVDSKLRPWKGQIYSSVKLKSDNRRTLLEIIEYCNKKGITTIFWNKEDPTHYDDKIHNFVDTALKFDHIFTTAQECVQKYREDYGHQSTHLLMFGGQPKLFNPIKEQKRTNDIIFAGSWYNQHPTRCKEMKEIFNNILDSGFNLKIYDRAFYTHKFDQNRIFPEEYAKFINPPLPFDQVKKIYKESKYALNLNTVTDSDTMFARRVFELMLCNTLVLSNYSKGMEKIFGDNVVFIENNEINLSNSGKKRIKNLYNVLKNHTYSNRFVEILNSINYEYIPKDNTVSIYYLVNAKFEIENILKHYESIHYNSKKLILLLSDQIPNHLIKNIYQEYANEEVSVYSLNYLLNQNGIIKNNSPYFIFANLKLKKDFIEKAILHYSYIESDVGITLGDEFVFKNETKKMENVLFSNENFIKTFKNIFENDLSEFLIYNIQI